MKLQNPLQHELTCYLLLRLVGYQSSLRPTEDCHNMRLYLLWRFPGLVFLVSTAWRSTGSTIRRWISETAGWESTSSWTRCRTRKEVWSASFFSLIEALSAISITVKNGFPLPAVEYDISRTSTVETNWSVVSCSPKISFSWLCW
ncbi:hypothetical protein TNCT_524571 [Trichonephila clavata]|uniref:Uncharacterized protein n=1 Tax=Trichonephila clavata TaxID=2740835 RepID=A0A8X6HCG1_TRICU|nr:hypothetical protein TNCT_524571 [Trichonephila clavata]